MQKLSKKTAYKTGAIKVGRADKAPIRCGCANGGFLIHAVFVYACAEK